MKMSINPIFICDIYVNNEVFKDICMYQEIGLVTDRFAGA